MIFQIGDLVQSLTVMRPWPGLVLDVVETTDPEFEIQYQVMWADMRTEIIPPCLLVHFKDELGPDIFASLL